MHIQTHRYVLVFILMNKIEKYLSQNPKLIYSVVGYMVKNDAVLLGVRKRVSFGLGEQLIAGIGGKVEKGEINQQALHREILEEICVKIISFREMGQVTYLFPHKPPWNQITTIYIIDTWQGDPEETEDIQPLWFKLTELPKERMWPDNIYTIPLILARKKINGTFLYNENGSIEEYQLAEIK